MVIASATDYEVLKTGCGLVDRSEMGKLALIGAEAKEFLQGQVSNDVEALTPGTGCYAALLTNKGKMLADLRVLDLGPELLLICERSALQGMFNQLRRTTIGRDATLEKRTVERSLFSLIGPGVGSLVDVPEPEHASHVLGLCGTDVTVVATDVGADIVCASTHGEAVRQALVDLGAVPVEAAAAEVIRVENGRPRYGIDLDESVIPQEAGLNDRAVSFTKGCYVGQETVARLFYRGKPNRTLRGLKLSGPGASRGEDVFRGSKLVGRLGSVVESPEHGVIALAIIRREAVAGDELTVADLTATLVDLPF